MSLLKTVESWDKAFDEADALLASGRLTALAATSRKNYENGTFMALHLDEFGDPETSLLRLCTVAPLLFGTAQTLELRHQEFQYIWRGEMIHGWLLVVVLPDE
jgi:hypothetical protein